MVSFNLRIAMWKLLKRFTNYSDELPTTLSLKSHFELVSDGVFGIGQPVLELQEVFNAQLLQFQGPLD